jgi:deoxyribose-phosphate aldolase
LFVKKAKEFTAGSPLKVITVIGFPYGFSAIEAKLAEVILAIVDGADELDMVINITALKNNDWQYLAREINAILPIIQNKGKLLKVVIESHLLSGNELIKCCDIYGASAVNYFSLSTGIESQLPALETVKLVRKHLADAVGLKVSGHFNTVEDVMAYKHAGVSRIGTRLIVK